MGEKRQNNRRRHPAWRPDPVARKRQEPHANHERWLVSYADFITLLFAFFVVMFASTQADKGKAQQVSDSVKRALEENQVAAAISGILGGAIDDKGKGNAQMRGPGGAKQAVPQKTENATKVAELLPSYQFLSKELQEELGAGKVQLHLGPRGLVVSLKEAAFFPSGDNALKASSYGTIEKIAGAMQRLPNQVRLEGHTDSIPIHNDRFRSNWELSAARAIAMLEILTAHYNVPHDKLAVAGYADTVPVESNESDEGRARNRRVDIVILNQSGLTTEPQAEAAAKAVAASAPAGDSSKPSAFSSPKH
jgi:chemotaxis protein MotB